MTPRPTTDQPEPDRPDDEFIAEMLEESEARAYLEGLDAAMDVIDGPIERTPQDVIVHDRGGRQVIVSATTTTGTGVVVVRSARVPSDRDRVVAALDSSNALNLADALVWAARIAEPRQLNL